MEVRALLAQNPVPQIQNPVTAHYNNVSLFGPSYTLVNINQHAFQPLICSDGCGCFDSFQRNTVTHHDRMRPTMQPIQQQPRCCGSADCICKKNQLLFDKVNRGTDMSMIILDSERIQKEQGQNQALPLGRVHHYHHIDLTSSANKNQFLLMRDNPDANSVSSIHEELPLKTTDRLQVLQPQNHNLHPFQHPPQMSTSINDTDGERLQTNPLNQFEEYVKRTQSASANQAANLQSLKFQQIKKNGRDPSFILNGSNNHSPQRVKYHNQDMAVIYPRDQKISITDNLIVGGVSIENKRGSTAGEVYNQPLIVGNPQIQIVKTICSTKNSFLPNFKTKKREYQGGEHKTSNIQNVQLIQNQSNEIRSHQRMSIRQGTPQSNQFDGRLFSPLSGSIGSKNNSPQFGNRRMQQNRGNSPQSIAEGVRKTEMQYLKKLEKLVQHKHKLSNLIKDTMTRTVRTQQIKTQQDHGQFYGSEFSNAIFKSITPEIYQNQNVPIFQVPESAQSSIRPRTNFVQSNNDTFSQQVEEFLSPMLNDYTSFNQPNQDSQPNYLTYPPPPPSQQNQRAVIIINQSQGAENTVNSPKQVTMSQNIQDVFPSQQQQHQAHFARRLSINNPNTQTPMHYQQVGEEIMRQGTEEDNNYHKFIVNEMKPNYHFEGAVKNLIQITNESNNSPGNRVLNAQKHGNLFGGMQSALDGQGIQLGGQITAGTLPAFGQDSTSVNRSSLRKGVLVHGDYSNNQVQLSRNLDDAVLDDVLMNKFDQKKSHNISKYFQGPGGKPQRAKSQGMNKRPKVNLKQEVNSRKRKQSGFSSQQRLGKKDSIKSSIESKYDAIHQREGEIRSLKIKQSSLQSKKLGSSISNHQNYDHFPEQTLNENRASSLNNRKVISERQSVDSSQYKTIKFKLMIMKSPNPTNNAIKTDGAALNSNRAKQNVTTLEEEKGGKQSSKNFRKVLKRHTMLDVVSGISNQIKKPAQHQSSMQVSSPNQKSKKADSPSKSGCRRTLKGRFDGIQGAQITMNQPLGPGPLPSENTHSNNASNININQDNIRLKPVQAAEKVSQDTFFNSSAVPLPNNMNSIYKNKQLISAHQRVIEKSPNDKESILEKSRYDQNRGEVEEEKISDDANGLSNKPQLNNENHMQNLSDDEFEEHLDDVIPQSSLKAKGVQGTLNDAFSFKSGGEFGGGFFSSGMTAQGDEIESENKNMLSCNLRKSAYQLLPRSGQSKRETSSKRANRKSHCKSLYFNFQKQDLELNQDLHSMIIQGGSKTRHNRDHQKTPTAQTIMQKGSSIKAIGNEDTVMLIAHQPTIIPKVDNIQDGDKHNDTLSFESSVHSSQSIKNDQIGIGENNKINGNEKSNEGIHFEDLYLRNANYIMRYLDAPQIKQEENEKQKEPSPPNPQMINQQNLTSLVKSTPINGHVTTTNNVSTLSQSQKLNGHKSAKQRIAEVQFMNQKLKVRPGELGSEVLQGRPIKPLKQLIKENFQKFALHNLLMLQDKKHKRQVQHHELFIDFSGSPNNSTHVIKKSPNIVEEDEDMRLSKYIWTTLNQLKQEGYPIDISIFPANFLSNQTPNNFDEDPGTATLDKMSRSYIDSKAFKNKRIKNASKNQNQNNHFENLASLENSEKVHGSVETSERTGTVGIRTKRPSMQENPNADLQIKFKDENPEGNKSSFTLRDQSNNLRYTTERSALQRTEEESIGAREDKNDDTLTSNPCSQRNENSFINPPVTSIYAQEFPLENINTPPTDNKDTTRKQETVKQRIPVTDYIHHQIKLNSDKDLDKFLGKTLPFDLHLLRMNSPNLPQQLSPRLSTSKTRVAEQVQISSQRPQSSKQNLNSIASQLTTGRLQTLGLFQVNNPNSKRNVRIHPTGGLRNSETLMDNKRLVNGSTYDKPAGDRNSKLLKSEILDLQPNDSLVRPSKDSKIPKGIGEIVIKTYDRIKSSIGSQDPQRGYFDQPNPAQIFLIKSPQLKTNNEISIQNGIQTNIMHLRNRSNKFGQNTLISPLSNHKQHNAELQEYSGAEIMIKDLNSLRNKDLLKLSLHSDYATPTPIQEKTMYLPKDQGFPQRSVMSRGAAFSLDKSRGTVLERRLINSNINYMHHQKGTPQSVISPTPTSSVKQQKILSSTPLSPTSTSVLSPHAFTNMLSIQGGGRLSAQNQFQHRRGGHSNIEERRVASQFMRVKKGRVLEDNIIGVKPSNGIRIIS